MSRDSNAKAKHISGREATHMAIENDKRRPIALDPAPVGTVKSASDAHLPVETEAHLPAETKAPSRKAPPRVLKPSRANDQVCAPTPRP